MSAKELEFPNDISALTALCINRDIRCKKCKCQRKIRQLFITQTTQWQIYVKIISVCKTTCDENHKERIYQLLSLTTVEKMKSKIKAKKKKEEKDFAPVDTTTVSTETEIKVQ